MPDDRGEHPDPQEMASLMDSATGVRTRSGEPKANGISEAPMRSGAPVAAPLPVMTLQSPLSDPLSEARPFDLPSFDAEPADETGAVPADGSDADVELQIELGRALVPIGESGSLREGAVVPLDKLAGDPVDILVDGRLIARGEVLVLDDAFCVRVAEIIGSSFPKETRTETIRL